MDEKYWGALGHLLYTIKTGKSAFRHLYDIDFQRYLQKDKKAALYFNVESNVAHDNSQIAKHFNFDAYPLIVDIGGESDALGQQVLNTYTHPQWILFNHPTTGQPKTEQTLSHERLQVKPGSFFETIPEGNLYILKTILSHWPDETCIQILKNLDKAMKPTNHVLIIETIIPSAHQPSLDKDFDIQKMAIGDSMMRSLNQLKDIIEKSGLSIVQINPITGTKLYCIECKKKPLAPSKIKT